MMDTLIVLSGEAKIDHYQDGLLALYDCEVHRGAEDPIPEEPL
jgi:hypothetical protein